MATWEDLDSESGSDKDEAGGEADLVVWLVAIVASKAERDTDFEDENEVYSKIPRVELIKSLKELFTHFEHRTNELKDLKEKYVDLLKRQEKTQAQKKKTTTFSTHPKGPIMIWAPKSEILDAADMLKRNGKAKVMIHRQWLLTTHDRRKLYVPNPNNERGRNCEI